MAIDRIDDAGRDWVPLSQAARELGLSRTTLYQRVVAGELQTWVNPFDRRQRLLRRRDLVRYGKPRREESPLTAA
jgi:hypothetical protein